jgi:hypothetical protein
MLKTVGFPSTRTGDQTIVDGNLVIGTAGKGVDFSVNPGLAGMTSELLDWYEEGTYTPVATANSGTITAYTATGNYTRIGRQVTVNIAVTLTTIGTANFGLLVTLPYTCGLFPAQGAGREDQNTGRMCQVRITSGAPTQANIWFVDNTTVFSANGNVVWATITYFV